MRAVKLPHYTKNPSVWARANRIAWQTQLHEILEGPLGFERSIKAPIRSSQKQNQFPARQVRAAHFSFSDIALSIREISLSRPPAAKQTALYHVGSKLQAVCNENTHNFAALASNILGEMCGMNFCRMCLQLLISENHINFRLRIS